MSFYPVLCNYVALPDSMIKNPGSLLKETNRQRGCESRQAQIQKLFSQFKEMTLLETNETQQNVDLLRPRANCYSFPEPSFNDTLMYPEIKQLIKYIKTKASSDEIKNLVNKSTQILSLYGLELVIQTTQDHHDELYNLLKFMIIELCLYPESFINKLELKKIVICDKKDYSQVQTQYSTKQTIFFPISLETSLTYLEVSKGLNKAILSQILTVVPEIMEEWERLIPITHGSQSINLSEDFEATYLCLVENANNHVYRIKVEKLKILLIKHFDSDLTAGWFRSVRTERREKSSIRLTSNGTLIGNY